MKRRAHPEVRHRRELFADIDERQTRTPPRRHTLLLQHFFEGPQLRLRCGATQLTAAALTHGAALPRPAVALAPRGAARRPRAAAAPRYPTTIPLAPRLRVPVHARRRDSGAPRHPPNSPRARDRARHPIPCAVSAQVVRCPATHIRVVSTNGATHCADARRPASSTRGCAIDPHARRGRARGLAPRAHPATARPPPDAPRPA